MRKLLQSWTRRAWLATWLQDRRRARQQPAPPTPNAPTINSGTYAFDVTQVGWADITLAWTFMHGTFPVANLELWKRLNGGSYVLLATVASTATGYYFSLACDSNGGTFDFKTRYKNGTTLGPFSNVFRVNVAAL